MPVTLASLNWILSPLHNTVTTGLAAKTHNKHHDEDSKDGDGDFFLYRLSAVSAPYVYVTLFYLDLI